MEKEEEKNREKKNRIVGIHCELFDIYIYIYIWVGLGWSYTWYNSK